MYNKEGQALKNIGDQLTNENKGSSEDPQVKFNQEVI